MTRLFVFLATSASEWTGRRRQARRHSLALMAAVKGNSGLAPTTNSRLAGNPRATEAPSAVQRFPFALPGALAVALCTLAHSPAAEEPVVALPPFLVEEVTQGPPWRYAELPGQEILSRCPDEDTRQVVEAHYRLHQLLGEILPEQLRVKHAVPKTLILYDEELRPAASQEIIARMLRPAAGTLAVEPGLTLGRGIRASLGASRVTFLPNLRLWDHDAMAVFMIVRREGFDPDHLALTSNYVTHLVKSRLPALPVWFVAGFLSLYEEIGFARGELTLPPFTWQFGTGAGAAKKNSPTPGALLPLADFFAGRLAAADPPGAPDAMLRWRKQAALFVRWGLDGRGSPRRQALWTLVERAATRAMTEELFRECFAFGYAAADEQLAAYRPAALRNTVRFRSRRSPAPALLLRNATDAQTARIKGDWQRMEVAYVKALSPELAPKYLAQARHTLLRAYERDVRDPGMLAVMGLCEVDAGNDPGAQEYLETAARIGNLRPRAWYELARLRFAGFKAKTAGGDGLLDATQAAAVLAPLFAARAAEPPLAEVYELIADVWAHCSAEPKRGHLAVLDEGAWLFPRRAVLVRHAAELNFRYGFRQEAAALCALGARAAADEATRERFLQLQQEVERK